MNAWYELLSDLVEPERLVAHILRDADGREVVIPVDEPDADTPHVVGG